MAIFAFCELGTTNVEVRHERFDMGPPSIQKEGFTWILDEPPAFDAEMQRLAVDIVPLDAIRCVP